MTMYATSKSGQIRAGWLGSAGWLKRLFHDANARICWGSSVSGTEPCVRTVIKLQANGQL